MSLCILFLVSCVFCLLFYYVTLSVVDFNSISDGQIRFGIGRDDITNRRQREARRGDHGPDDGNPTHETARLPKHRKRFQPAFSAGRNSMERKIAREGHAQVNYRKRQAA